VQSFRPDVTEGSAGKSTLRNHVIAAGAERRDRDDGTESDAHRLA
jgi:hypothetical protein